MYFTEFFNVTRDTDIRKLGGLGDRGGIFSPDNSCNFHVGFLLDRF
jgi:hypothetical protein